MTFFMPALSPPATLRGAFFVGIAWIVHAIRETEPGNQRKTGSIDRYRPRLCPDCSFYVHLTATLGTSFAHLDGDTSVQPV